MNKAPKAFRRIYLARGRAFAERVRRSGFLRSLIRFLMDQVIEQTTYVYA